MEDSPQRGHTAAKRRQLIIIALRAEGFLSIAELTRRIDVSHMTVRRDLVHLESSGQVRIVHGGASLSVTALSRRWGSPAVGDESQIAKAAANLICETDTIAIDAGRLGYEVAKALPEGFHGTVITNSIPVIQLLISRSPTPRVVGLGGEIMTDSFAFVGANTLAAIARVRVETLFLSVDALDDRGVYAQTDAEASVKRAFLEIANRTVVVAGHDCFGDSAPLRLGGWNRVASLVTDGRPGMKMQRVLQQAGVDVIIAAEPENVPSSGVKPSNRLILGSLEY